MKAAIFANGALGDHALLKARLSVWSPDQIICADGGADHAATLGLTPNVIIGDMDSVSSEAAFTAARLIRYASEKNESDLELALLYAVEEGIAEIAVIGAMGGRIDMILANILLLAHPALADIPVALWEGNQTAWLLRAPGGSLHGAVGDTLSLIPMGGDAVGIRTEGLRYPLRDETLTSGPARGVSNVIDSQEAAVFFNDGLLLVVHTPGRA